MTSEITIEAVTELLGKHVSLYNYKPPTYQTEMLSSLARVWVGHHRTLLDIGGGTGLMAEAISEFLPVDSVTAIDVVDRFADGLSVHTMTYDGQLLPFGEGEFDAATINNVVHHIPVSDRKRIFKEIRRVVAGPLYIKDHVSTGRLSDFQLTVLDVLGNVPFGGMTTAQYLSQADWADLANSAGYSIARQHTGEYRSGASAAVFPNSLEVTFRLDPMDS